MTPADQERLRLAAIKRARKAALQAKGDEAMSAVHYWVRCRVCVRASPKEGHRSSWTEYQVVGPRGRVMSRWDLEEQAHEAVRKLQAEAAK